MLDKERLLNIAELDSAKIEQMDESQLESFIIAINAFIDGIPAQGENVKNAFRAKDRDALIKSLEAIRDMLRQICAEKLAELCSNRISTIDDVQQEDLQAFVVDFLKAASTLSIDLQMLEYEGSSPLEDTQAPAGKNTILAVDDQHFFLNSIKVMLQDSGYKLTCINSGTSALNYLKVNQPDLFILDIEMPAMDGYELARRIRASGQTAPIIFLTGNSTKSSVLQALQAGADDFIVKPVSKDQLLKRIGKYIKAKPPDKK